MANFGESQAFPRGIKNLLILTILIFFGTLAFESRNVDVTGWLGLHLPGSPQWGPWQYLTSIFMHGNFSHLFFNMFALYMFGRVLEQVWGTGRFIAYYLICGIGAGLICNLVSWFEYHSILAPCAAFMSDKTPDMFFDVVQRLSDNYYNRDALFSFIDTWRANVNNIGCINEATQFVTSVQTQYQHLYDYSTTIGASGAIFGLLLAFGVLFPNTAIFFLFIPIPIKAKYFVIIYAVIELIAGVQRVPGDNIAHFAHLGGMLIGFIMLKIWHMRRSDYY